MYPFSLHSKEAPECQVNRFLLPGLSLTNALVTETYSHLISANARTVKGAGFPPKGMPRPHPSFLSIATTPYSREMRCSDASFPEMLRVDGCEDTKGLGHLQNLQRRHLKADLQQAKDVERVRMRSRRGPPKQADSHRDWQPLRWWSQDGLQRISVVQRLLWLLLRDVT